MFNLNPPSVRLLSLSNSHSPSLIHTPSQPSTHGSPSSILTRRPQCGVPEIDDICTLQRQSGRNRLNCIVGAVSNRPLCASYFFRCPTIFCYLNPQHAIHLIRTALSSPRRISGHCREQQIFRIFSTFSFRTPCRAQLGSNDRTTRPEVVVDLEEDPRAVGEVEEELRAVEMDERKELTMVDRGRNRSRRRRGSSLLVSKLSTSFSQRSTAR